MIKKMALFFTLFAVVCFFSDASVYARGPIKVRLQDQTVIIFPEYFTEISSVAQNHQATYPNQSITVPQRVAWMDEEILHYFCHDVERLLEAARDAEGKKVASDHVDGQTIFVHSLVEEQVYQRAQYLSDDKIVRLFKTADYFGVLPLCDVYACFMAERIKEEVGIDKIGEVTQQQVEKKFGQSFGDDFRYLKKYLFLARLGWKEHTVADELGLYGQPNIKNHRIELKERGITSLIGIERIIDKEEVHELVLQQNHLLGSDIEINFPRSPFENFPQLKILDLSQNPQMNQIPSVMFRGVPKLEFLSLQSNGMQEVPEGLFRSVPCLQKLLLDSNKFQQLPSGIFDGLSKLTTLHLERNRLKFLSDSLFKDLSNLQHLDVSLNELDALTPDVFQGLSNLQTFVAAENKLKELPVGVFYASPKLEGLFLYNNQLERLSEMAFCDLKGLQILHLGSNGLKEIPASVFSHCVELDYLDLSCNQLHQLPEEMASIPMVIIYGNPLSGVHENGVMVRLGR